MAKQESTNKTQEKDPSQVVSLIRRTLEEVLEKDGNSNFLASEAPPNQPVVLLTYAVPDKVPNEKGTVAIIKILGCFPNEKQAEDRAEKELDKTYCELVRIEPTGNWFRLRDPRISNRTEYDHYIKNPEGDNAGQDKCSKGEIKKILSKQNADLHNKKRAEEKEIEEAKQAVIKESQEDDSETFDHFMILCMKMAQNPGIIAMHQEQIRKSTLEIGRLQELVPKYQEEYTKLATKYPEYVEKIKQLQSSNAASSTSSKSKKQ